MKGGAGHRRASRGLIGGGAALLALAAILAVVVATRSGSRHGRSGPAVPTAPQTALPTVPGSQRTALPPPAGEQFGVSVNLLFNRLAYAQRQIDAQLHAVRATGATLARSDALWEASEPRAPAGGHHTYDWSFDDRIAGSLAAHGLTWLPILDYSAPWAQSILGQDHSPPRADGDYAAYAAAFAARYGAGGAFWRAHPALAPQPVTAIEIWNEPDNGQFWAPTPDPAGYATLYLDARGAIDAVDPGIRVIVGGLTDPTAFLPAMVQAQPGLHGHIDGVAIHPYGAPAAVVNRVRAARATLVSLGMAGVPLYVTEFGWTTSPPGAVGYAPDARRPVLILQTLTDLGHLRCGVAATILYTWVAPQTDPADSQDWYGIADPHDPGAPTADTSAFTAGLRGARAPETSSSASAAATQPRTGSPIPSACPA